MTENYNITKYADIVRNTTPLVHSITNYVTVNDCANVLLACGASPIMADDENEVCEITSICSALNINIGTLNKRTVASMLKAGKMSAKLGHPVVLDPVGAGASRLRTDTALEIIKTVRLSVIKGNISEIMTLLDGSGQTSGVDSSVSDAITEENLDEKIKIAKILANKNQCVIAVTGAIDIVTDGDKTYVIRNGHHIMSNITGTGCMLSAVTAAYCAVAKLDCQTDAVACAVAMMGVCGELAWEKVKDVRGGTGRFRVALIDEISLITSEKLEKVAKIEKK